MKPKILFIIVVFGAIVCGCKSVAPIVVPTVHNRDSVRAEETYKHDSIFTDRWHTIYIQGDTVFIHDSIFTDRWHTLRVHDTLSVSTSDTVPVEVERQLTSNQVFLIRSGVACWIIVGILFLLIIIRIALKLRGI